MNARVDVVEPMGMETLVHFFVNGAPITARSTPRCMPADEMLPLAADLNQMHLIENEGGRVV